MDGDGSDGQTNVDLAIVIVTGETANGESACRPREKYNTHKLSSTRVYTERV